MQNFRIHVRRNRERMLLLFGVLLIELTRFGLSFGPQKAAVDYAKLNTQQQSLFSAYRQAHNRNWDDLNSSEQVEFAGATQAIGDWWKFEPGIPLPQPGLERTVAINEVHGKIPNAKSEDQFNLEVTWTAQSDHAFRNASNWSVHIPVFHSGQHGYQQNKNGDPFLGLVVLFGNDDQTKGQFHVGMRGFPGHFFPDNGNVAKNYQKYSDWYGPIDGYDPKISTLRIVRQAGASP